eukprot:TRINITY_DN2654_c0_g2_i1.p1 TRINITY_DN2654_c0_g2~~TRINITY_DN2654_c0_g2_i1.p1  ORF type:complete len:125 (-),score=17.00 TRINITY_DN2654_c0_g2_i1:937-1311(-)
MKLLTHNMLSSKAIKNVREGFPLLIEARDVKVSEAEFNQEFIAKIIPKVDWDALRRAAEQLGHLESLPLAVPQGFENDTDFLKQAHHALYEIELINGNLVCPETGRKFPVSDGIPNMLLNEDEI